MSSHLPDPAPSPPARLVLPGGGQAPNPAVKIITTFEANHRHGTGALILTLFKHFRNPEPSLWYTLPHYGAPPLLDDARLLWGAWLPPRGSGRGWRIARLLSHVLRDGLLLRTWMRIQGGAPAMVYVAPFDRCAVRLAIAAAEVYGAKILLHVLDDCAIHWNQIPRDLLLRLCELASIRCAISPRMAELYQEATGRRFEVLFMPISGEDLPDPTRRRPPRSGQERLVMIGNFYGDTFPLVRQLFRETAGARLTLFGPLQTAAIPEGCTPQTEAWLDYRGMVSPDSVAPLLSLLTEHDIALMPQGSLQLPGMGKFFQYSLPSRIASYLAAGLPILVLGSEESGAARFVVEHGLGRVTPYAPDAFGRVLREMSCADWHGETSARARAFCERFLHLEDVIDPWLRRALRAAQEGSSIPPAPPLGGA
jgi:hypothetical protein